MTTYLRFRISDILFQMRVLYFTTVFLMFAISNALAQSKKAKPVNRTLSSNYYPKLASTLGEFMEAGVDSIYIDTLVLADNSTIRFDRKSILIVENAFIGDNCELTSAGADGTENSESGQNGQDFICIMIFKRLGILTINAQGGNGKKGLRGADAGRMGTQGSDGGRGQPGGNGGNGGNVKLVCSGDGFTPSINSNGPNQIIVKLDGGLGGEGGAGGSAGRPIRPYNGYGRQGKPGANGVPGRGGILTQQKMQ